MQTSCMIYTLAFSICDSSPVRSSIHECIGSADLISSIKVNLFKYQSWSYTVSDLHMQVKSDFSPVIIKKQANSSELVLVKRSGTLSASSSQKNITMFTNRKRLYMILD